jgi:hypothetical protein
MALVPFKREMQGEGGGATARHVFAMGGLILPSRLQEVRGPSLPASKERLVYSLKMADLVA